MGIHKNIRNGGSGRNKTKRSSSLSSDRKRSSNDRKRRIIDRQSSEIESLKRKISRLEIAASEKDELLSSVDGLINDMRESVDSIQDKSDEYDRLIAELRDMRKIMDEEVFHRKWWILKHVLR